MTLLPSIVNFGHPGGLDAGSLVSEAAKLLGFDLKILTSKPSELFYDFNYGEINWRDNLQNAQWLINSSTTVLEGLSPKYAWAASMIFGELEGSKTVMVVDAPEDNSQIPEMWGLVIEKIRQIHILYFTKKALKSISELENITENKLLSKIRINGLVPIVCSYDEENQVASIVHSMGELKVDVNKNILYSDWLANFLYRLPTQTLNDDALKIAASGADS